MTIICCICPGGCGQPASQAVNQPVSRCDRPTNCLGRQLALSCPCQRWRCSIWFNLDAPLDAQRSTPDAIGRCRFRHNLYKVSQFLALCICCWQHRAPWPVARSRCVPGRTLHRTVARPYCCHKTTTSGCTLLQQNWGKNFDILSQVYAVCKVCAARRYPNRSARLGGAWLLLIAKRSSNCFHNSIKINTRSGIRIYLFTHICVAAAARVGVVVGDTLWFDFDCAFFNLINLSRFSPHTFRPKNKSLAMRDKRNEIQYKL